MTVPEKIYNLRDKLKMLHGKTYRKELYNEECNMAAKEIYEMLQKQPVSSSEIIEYCSGITYVDRVEENEEVAELINKNIFTPLDYVPAVNGEILYRYMLLNRIVRQFEKLAKRQGYEAVITPVNGDGLWHLERIEENI